MNQSADEPTDKLKTPPSLWKDQLIHVGRPNVGDVEALIERVRGICERRWLSNDGPLVQEFERRVADIAGVKHCIACATRLSLWRSRFAQQISRERSSCPPTRLSPRHTPWKWQKIRPVFCDIEAHTHNIDASKVEALITPQTRAIVGVHLWGRACDVDSLSDIAKRHGLHSCLMPAMPSEVLIETPVSAALDLPKCSAFMQRNSLTVVRAERSSPMMTLWRPK